jgi:lipoprotein-anchoring transpeptidase ErfK/SrfK
MVFRTAGAIASLLLGLGGPSGLAQQALAQYYPPSQAYPPPQAYPPSQGYPSQGYQPPYRSLPPVDVADDDAPFYDPPIGRPSPPAAILPPPALGPQATEPLPLPGARSGRRGEIEEAELPPPGAISRDVPPGLEPVEPGTRVVRPYYGAPPAQGTPPGYGPPPAAAQPGSQEAPQVPQGYEPAAAGSRPYYPPGTQPPAAALQPDQGEPEGLRPPLPIGPPPLFALPGPFAPPQAQPGRAEQGATGSVAALPPEVRPETGPTKELPPQFRRTLVDYRGKEPAGTIIIDTPNTYLYLVLGDGKALRYGVGVGREGFTWNGAEKVTRMAEWPDWHPPEEMIERQPYLPRFMAGGPGNPLGARALYLGKTVYRIHGTNQPSTIGTFVSSGCIRLTNDDVADLYTRVKVGTRVVVLPGGKPAATASAAPAGPPLGVSPGAPQVMTPPGGLPPSAMAR